jgi:hypothetical protein
MRTGAGGRVDGATVAAVAGVAGVGALVPLLLLAMSATDYEIWGGLLVALALVVVSAPFLYRIGQRDDRRIAQLVTLALVAKLTAAALRYFVAFEVYGGSADAVMYIEWGQDLAASFSQGVFSVDVGRSQFVGTGFMRYLSGLAFVLIGTSGLGAFFFFSWLGFWGLYGCFRAFRIAFPAVDPLRYGVLLFLMPSLLYWPSSIGKEAWMLLMLGLIAVGAAKVFDRRPGGYLPLLAGVAGAVAMRPHVAALVCLALAAGYLRRTNRDRASFLGPAPQVVGLALLVVGTFFVVDRTEEYFDLDEVDPSQTAAQAILDRTWDQTATGGSAFAADRVRSPLDLPSAAVTVLFRPLPWEAANPQMLLSGLEGMVLLGLVLISWRRVWAGLKGAWAHPYLRYAAVFTLGFVVAYAAVANFGILARQRAQLYPFLLVFLALPSGGLPGRNVRVRWSEVPAPSSRAPAASDVPDTPESPGASGPNRLPGLG